jgi:hypothetical protein
LSSDTFACMFLLNVWAAAGFKNVAVVVSRSSNAAIIFRSQNTAKLIEAAKHDNNALGLRTIDAKLQLRRAPFTTPPQYLISSKKKVWDRSVSKSSRVAPADSMRPVRSGEFSASEIIGRSL